MCTFTELQEVNLPYIKAITIPRYNKYNFFNQILGPEAYERHLALSVRSAEAAAGDDAFHCRRPNCTGWWLLDAMGLLDGQNQVSCPVCNTPNCMQCRAIHEGQNCREFQDDIRRRADNDQTAQATQEALDVRVDYCNQRSSTL